MIGEFQEPEEGTFICIVCGSELDKVFMSPDINVCEDCFCEIYEED